MHSKVQMNKPYSISIPVSDFPHVVDFYRISNGAKDNKSGPSPLQAAASSLQAPLKRPTLDIAVVRTISTKSIRPILLGGHYKF